MRSLEKIWVRTKAQNDPFPTELLGVIVLKGLIVWGCLYFFLTFEVWNFLVLGQYYPCITSDKHQSRLWLQSDNTVKELRNQYGIVWVRGFDITYPMRDIQSMH